MSNSILKTKKDKELFEKWNKKLEKYDDCNAEDFSTETPLLKEWHNFWFRRFKPDQIEAVSEYYSKCRELLEHGNFPSALHKEVWKYYSEGLPLRDISDKVKGRINKDTVAKYIKAVKKYAGSKTSNKARKP